MEAFLMEKATVKVLVDPVDFNTGANPAAARVDMSKCDRVTFLVIAAAGSTPNAHSFLLKQADAASSGNVKALSVANPYYVKASAATSFAKVDVDSATDAYDIDSLVVDGKFVAAFEVLADQLDANNGYRYAYIDTVDFGGAQLGTVIAICHSRMSKPAYTAVV